MPLDFLVSKTPLVPSNSTMCPRNAPKRPPEAPEAAQFGHRQPFGGGGGGGGLAVRGVRASRRNGLGGQYPVETLLHAVSQT